jgi:hypothetical protein
MKALLATPLHTGSADREFIVGLLQAHGLYAGWTCLDGHANICRARDLLVAQFLATDCTTLVFIDGDVGFGRDDLQRLLAAPVPICSGLYQRKNGSGDWVCHPQPGDAPLNRDHPELRSVARVGAGFLRIDREVFEKLILGGHVVDYPVNETRVHQFFPTGVLNGEFVSEDYYFCALAARAGYSIHIDTRIKLKHVGRLVYQATSLDR